MEFPTAQDIARASACLGALTPQSEAVAVVSWAAELTVVARSLADQATPVERAMRFAVINEIVHRLLGQAVAALQPVPAARYPADVLVRDALARAKDINAEDSIARPLMRVLGLQ
jgi:hypothetical protein